MKTSPRGISLIKKFESCRLTAYLDAVNIFTIGWGTTVYRDGRRVKSGDVITQGKADELLLWQVGLKEVAVNGAIHPVSVNQNQFDALVSFAYNIGIEGLLRSTLLKKLRVDPDDKTIRKEFMRWVKGQVNGKMVTLNGLVRRRTAEANLYFKPVKELKN